MKFLRRAITAKIESAYATDSVPTAAGNSILCAAITVTPLKLEAKTRTLVNPYLGGSGKLIAGQHVEIQLDIEMAGTDAAGNAPGIRALLRACALGETLNAGVSAVYATISTAEESTSIYWYMDGMRHKILGARGDLSWKLVKTDAPMWVFKLMGLYVGPTDTALIVPDVSVFAQPVPVNNVNTTPVTLHGYACRLAEASGALNNKCVYRNLPGVEEIAFVDRNAAGNFVIEAPAIATKDFFTIAKNGTRGTFSVTHGPAGGRKVQIDYASTQLYDPVYQDQDGIAMLAMTADMPPSSAGNDEVTFTFL